MQQLLILRHADAALWEPGGDDFSRPLSEAGMLHAESVARYITAKLQSPQRILCSSARRTRETLQPLLSIQARLKKVTRFDPQIYNARVETLTALLDFAFAENDRILMVGHNPGASHLASRVIAGSAGAAISGLAPGTLAVVDFESGWEIGTGRGCLDRVVSYGDLSVD